MSKKEDIVKSLIHSQEQMNNLTVDEIAKTPVSEPEPIMQMSARDKAKQENIQYIESIRSMPALGVLPEKLKAEHRHAWEYVKGIFENYEVNGEPVRFWFCQYPGDKDCLWEVPCNRPVYVPRCIAKHLAETMVYHSFGFVEKPQHSWRPDDFTANFTATATHHRGMFRALGAFA